ADRIDAYLGCGGEESVIGDLRAALEDDPLQERAWRQLMVALYRRGRESEALAAFRTARNLFIEELGAEPSQALSDVHMAILERSLPSSAGQEQQPAPPASLVDDSTTL